jgi:protein disulfide-isomerase A1
VHYFVASEAQRQAYLREMRPLAKKYREYLSFTTIDVAEYADMQASLGLRPSSSGGGLAVQNPSNGDVFPYQGAEAISLPVVEQFLVDIIQGQVKPWKGPGLDSGAGAGNDGASAADKGRDEL